jgi:7-cyano-7-deazaguanine synthase in queuosine biosynthesis
METFTFDLTKPGALKQQNAGIAHFSIDDQQIANGFTTLLNDHVADLVEIAASINACDRLAPHRGHQQRTLIVTIGVRDPDFWNQATIQTGIRNVLEFLTLDEWNCTFVPQQAERRASQRQHHLFENDLPTEVSLFSGGLDSYAGTAQRLNEATAAHLACVSIATNARPRQHQREQTQRLKRSAGARITHIVIPYQVHGAPQQDPLRRTRGFLFLALGSATVLAAGQDHLYVYENGYGAINLPYDPSQYGIDHTRAMHPETLRRMSAFVSTVSGQPFRIRNRAQFQTKAQLCKAGIVPEIRAGIKDTFSCDAYPVRRRGATHCGYCTSCILRRLALIGADMTTDDTTYLYGWHDPAFTGVRHRRRGLHAMHWQAEQLRENLLAPTPWPSLLASFPELAAALPALAAEDKPDRSRDGILRLYQNHIGEWARLCATQEIAL